MRRVEPGPGQESVWDYPRPPRVERAAAVVRVVLAGRTIGRSEHALRVTETSHPPVYYLPPPDVDAAALRPSSSRSFCEFKGEARYWSLAVEGRVVADAAWFYPQPSPGFEELADAIAFFPGRVDACFVGGERVVPQQGGFYGGWITSAIVGPFKGGPGTRGW